MKINFENFYKSQNFTEAQIANHKQLLIDKEIERQKWIADTEKRTKDMVIVK